MQDVKESFIEEQSWIEGAHDRYKTLFERINAAAFLTTFDGQILESNQKSYELLGYDLTELLYLSLKDFISEETDWDSCRDELAARGGYTFETESVSKDGTRCPVEANISLFKMKGKLVMFVLLWDITDRKKAENRLKESEKKYHGLFEFTTDGIFVLDARGEIIDVNTKICEMLDITKHVVIGKNLFNMDVLTARSLPVIVQQFEQLLSERTTTTFTTEVKHSSGKVLDVEISSFFLVKKDSEVDNFVLIMRDITARNEAEKKRLREHELLKTLMDNIPDSVYFKDENHRFIMVNAAKAAHSNVKPEEMMGKTDFDFLPPEQAQKIVDDDTMMMRCGQPIINKLEKLTREDGSERWVSVTKIPRVNEEGDIAGTMGISRDVTEWKQTEEELARNHELLQTLMDTIPDSVYFKDMQHRFILVNKAKAERWHVSPQSMLGKTDFDYLPQDQAQKACDDDTKVLQTGIPLINVMEKITRSDGVEQWFSVTKVPRFDRNGVIIGTMGISRDITAWKQQNNVGAH